MGLLLCRVPLNSDPAAGIFVRINQVGYLTGETKVALALTDQSLAGQTFRVNKTPGGATAFTATVGADRGAYGDFSHLYELNFTALNAPGTYTLSVAGAASLSFPVGADVFSGVIPKSLTFFRVQRCGNTAPLHHKACHLKDGFAAGGWHDAGDYLKFMVTIGDTVNLLLTAYDRNPAAFSDANHNGTPDVLEEMLIGLDWIYRMWDPSHNSLYYQVGDERDHEVGWRLPDNDDANGIVRAVYACSPGKGANIAGKAAAALALASRIWGDPQNSFANPQLAARYLTAAEQIYDYGKKRPAAQPGHQFYGDPSWRDDMALGAVELYRATGQSNYLNDARTYGKAAGNAWTVDWSQMHSLAHYEIGRTDSVYRPTAIATLKREMNAYRDQAARNPFRASLPLFYWGSATVLAGQALEMLWYEDLSGDAAYHTLAQQQRDYVLGGNPWGVCWVNSAGKVWSRHPHHQISDLTGTQLVGFWNEGPDKKSDWESYGLELRNADAYAAFQSDAAVYHDDVEDYVTNEPTIFANAIGMALLSWYRQSVPTGTAR